MVSRRDAKEWGRENIRGLFTSPTIPFTPDFKLDEAGIRRNVDRMLAVKSSGIGFGFTEPWVLSHDERKRAMEVALDAARGRAVAYLHVTDHSVADTVAFAQYARDIGADAVMIWAPYEWAKSQDMVVEYYEHVASQVDIAIFAYNTYHSGIGLAPETCSRIADIENVCAIKIGLNDIGQTIRTMELCGDRIVVADPLEKNLLTMTLQFGQQVLLGTTSIFLLQNDEVQPIHEYQQLALAGRGAEAAKRFYELQPLRDVWEGIYTVLWDKEKAVHPLATIKYWMDLVGMAGGPLRPPSRQITDAEKMAFKSRLDAAGWQDLLSRPKIAAE